MAKSDFLSWDFDIDLDALLGEYTEDDTPEVHEKKPRKDIPSDGFKCPECNRVLKTIAGFRGHVTKQHNKANLKAHQHKVKNGATEEIKITRSTPLDVPIPSIFEATFNSTLESMAKDPMHKIFGDSEVAALSRVAMCLSGVQQFFLDVFLDIFSKGRSLCSALDREHMFQTFHQTRVSAAFTRGYMLLLGTLTFTGQGICDFVNILMMDLIGNLIKEQVKKGVKNAEVEHERISDSDQSILFYICGFITRSLKKQT